MSATPPPTRRILILAPASGDEAPATPGLAAGAEAHIVRSVEEALAALSTGQYETIVSRPSDLFRLARSEARERGELILDRLGQGVCIVNAAGELIWANPKLNSYPREVREAIREQCVQMCHQLAASGAARGPVPTRRRTVRVGADHVFDVTVSPLATLEQQVQEVVGLIWDISAAHRLQERINAIDAAGRELVRLDTEALAQLDVADRLKLLEEKIIRFARDLLAFDHFIVRVLDRQTNRLEPVIAYGLSEQVLTMPIYATSEGNGISGYVAATGRSYICPDVSKDPRYLPGLEHAGSSLTVPLRLHDQIVGVLDVEAHEVGAFTEDDRQFAEIFARHIAIALHILKLLAVERSTATGQVATDVATELAAPLNDIIAEATSIMETCGEQEDLRRHLSAIIDNVDRVKRTLQTLDSGAAVSGLVPEIAVRDPLLDGKRVLVADDEEIIRQTIADVLTKSGALAVMARDGQEAVAMIRSQHFDLVISDIKMPYKNGYEVFAAARQANLHCRVVLITGFGYDPEHSILRASKEGLAGVLFKPFKVEQLMERVRQALAAEAT